MKITNRLNLPKAIVDACETKEHCAFGSLSVTTLLKGTKEIILTNRHWEELEDDAADRIWAIFGTAVHKVLESTETETGFNEEYLSFEVDGIRIVGKMDVYDMVTHLIDDYKTASVWKIIKADFDDWKRQGIGYGWLLKQNGFDVKGARFTALLKDHKKNETKNNHEYPQSPAYVYAFDISNADIFAFDCFVREKVREYKAMIELPDDEIPPCSAGERWATIDTYAVMKDGRKSAVRVLSSSEDAERFIADGNEKCTIQKRPGESKKCLEYCACAEYCNFYKLMIKENDNGGI